VARSRKAIQGIDRGSVMRRQLVHIPDTQFIVLPEAAHSINWERPEVFNRKRPGLHPQTATRRL